MKKLLSSLLALTLVLALAFAFTGCGSSGGDDAASEIEIAVPNDTTNEARALLLLQDNARRERTAVSSLSPDGPCYLIRQSSLKELLASLLTAAGQESGTLEQRFGRMYQEWGIIQPDSNCDYLTEAVLIAGQSKGKLAIRKEILQGVAEHHNVTVAAVDSGLRRLIDALETRQMPA